jgi:hypothetical protein
VNPVPEDQIAVVREVMKQKPHVDGIAISVIDAKVVTSVLI